MTNQTDAEKMRDACAKMCEDASWRLTDPRDGSVMPENADAVRQCLDLYLAIRALPLPTPARTYEDGVTQVHMLGMHAAELAVSFSKLGLFPCIGVDDGGEFVLGPFVDRNGDSPTGCASIHWDGPDAGYSWSYYMQIGDKKFVSNSAPIDTIPDDLTAAILALIKEPTNG